MGTDGERHSRCALPGGALARARLALASGVQSISDVSRLILSARHRRAIARRPLRHQLRPAAFQLALDLLPIRCGRMIQIALWPRIGYTRSMRLACSLGMAGAVVTALIGLSTNNSMLVMIAIF